MIALTKKKDTPSPATENYFWVDEGRFNETINHQQSQVDVINVNIERVRQIERYKGIDAVVIKHLTTKEFDAAFSAFSEWLARASQNNFLADHVVKTEWRQLLHDTILNQCKWIDDARYPQCSHWQEIDTTPSVIEELRQKNIPQIDNWSDTGWIVYDSTSDNYRLNPAKVKEIFVDTHFSADTQTKRDALALIEEYRRNQAEYKRRFGRLGIAPRTSIDETTARRIMNLK